MAKRLQKEKDKFIGKHAIKKKTAEIMDQAQDGSLLKNDVVSLPRE